VCLRYFNVYGEHQRFDAYGNVIPIFAERILRGRPLTIFGDGEQTRDFVNVADVVAANLAAAGGAAAGCFNIGSGTRIGINDLVRRMRGILAREVEVVHGPPRKGDVRDSLADVSAARAGLGFAPAVTLDSGLTRYLSWLERDAVTQRRWESEA
jgi:UDP-glucose 4-epimerase